MLRFHQCLFAISVIMVFDVSLKANPTIIMRDLIWTSLVFAGMALWDYLVLYNNKMPPSNTL